MRKLTALNQKWYEQTIVNRIPKLNLFQKIKVISDDSITIHQIINQNSGIKLKYLNDIELLKMARKRKSITQYFQEEYFKVAYLSDSENIQHNRRRSNFTKWYQKLKKRKIK